MAHLAHLAQSRALYQARGVQSGEKAKAVADIFDKLNKDLESPNLSDGERDSLLERLKIYGRDPIGSNAIFTTEGIETLAKHGFQTPSKPYSKQALRCLANALFLKPDARGKLVDLGFAPKACLQISQGDVEDEFLGSRILFLTTYATQDHILDIVDNHDLATHVASNLNRHANLPVPPSTDKTPANPIIQMALIDTLNLIFNITNHLSKSHPDKIALFSSVAAPITNLLLTRPPAPNSKPLDTPTDKLINALLNLDLASEAVTTTLYPSESPTAFPSHLSSLLSNSMSTYPTSAHETTLTPLVSLILKLLPSAPAEVREHFQKTLLPSPEERTQALGHETSTSLPAHLLRGTTNPLAPDLRILLGHLFFELSDKNPSTLVDNVGYGFASGYLFQNNIPVPESVREAHEDPETKRPANPVTGQFLDAETVPDMPEMTDEEKEREAERLFVLFERLKKTGVVNVENPVTAAYQSGRIHELGSDEDEEDYKTKSK